MIDLKNEHAITVPEAAAAVPGGTTTRIVYTWINRGIGGIRLEAIKLGGAWYTSHEAIQRFGDRLTEAQHAKRGDRPRSTTRDRRYRRAQRELDRMGVTSNDKTQNPCRPDGNGPP